MSKNKKKIPVPDPEDDEEYICPSALWDDMAGLIPYAAEGRSDRASYDVGCPFLTEYGGNKDTKQK
jgi:hypothetical protein